MFQARKPLPRAPEKHLPHFVENYRRFVDSLLRTHSLDEAMSKAVGGDFETIGSIERDILHWAGLRDGMVLVDMGCGSGRLSKAIEGQSDVAYIGLDAVPALLAYAQSRAAPHCKFVAIDDLALPLASQSADMIAVFAVFAHMLTSEAYLYLRDMLRVLKPGGCVVMSFIEIAEPAHWVDFMAEVDSHVTGTFLHQFIERPTIDVWCDKLGFVRETFVSRHEAPWGSSPLGQALAILRKPEIDTIRLDA